MPHFRCFRLAPIALCGLVAACSAKSAATADDAAASDVPAAVDTAADSASTDTTGLPLLATATGASNFAVAANGWYRGDLHFHTNYSGDAKQQGGDDLGPALNIADAWRDPV